MEDNNEERGGEMPHPFKGVVSGGVERQHRITNALSCDAMFHGHLKRLLSEAYQSGYLASGVDKGDALDSREKSITRREIAFKHDKAGLLGLLSGLSFGIGLIVGVVIGVW